MNILLKMAGDVDGGHMARAIPITSGFLDSCILPLSDLNTEMRSVAL